MKVETKGNVRVELKYTEQGAEMTEEPEELITGEWLQLWRGAGRGK